MRTFSVFLLLGTLLIQGFSELPSWELALVLLCVCLFITFLLKNKSTAVNTALLSISGLLLGVTFASFHATQLINNRLSVAVEGKELLVTARIVGIPTVRDDGTRFLADVYNAKLVEKPTEIIDLRGKIRLGWFQQRQNIQAGDLWQLKVKLKRPAGFLNPGGFDYEKWLFTQRILASGYVRKSKPDEINPNQKLNQTITPAVFWSVDGWRQKIHQAIQQRVDDKPSAAVLSALLVAVRDKLNDQQWQLLQGTGTSHLVAISGLHVAVVAGFAFFPMMLLWRLFPRLNERVPLRVAGAVVGTIFAVFYALLAGFTLPTQRALLMVIIGLWALVSRRNYDASTVLALALILVLLWDPLAAMTASFWLSFLAVFLILIFMKRQSEKPRWMVIKLQLFLSLAMLPLTLLFFGSASLTAPFANLFAIPWVSLLVVPVSLLALLLMPISTFLSTKLLTIAAYLIELLFKGLEILGESRLSALTIAEIPTSLLILAFVGIIVLLFPKGFPAKWLGLVLLLPAVFHQAETPNEGEFNYTLLDVGQGYASVLQTKSHQLIYDTGTRISDSFDLGKLVVAPYLRAKGITQIDKMIISHEDIDHRGGAQYLMENFELTELISSDTNALKGSRPCVRGQKWQWDGVNFEVLSPRKNFKGNDNNRSCVLKVWNNHHSLLLTGDIQKQTELALLLFDSKKLASDVISVPHHGSKTSSTLAFIKQVSPQIGLISAGYRSRFGHPKPTVVKRYRELDIELLNTVDSGAISLYFPADQSEIQTDLYRLNKRGFWSR